MLCNSILHLQILHNRIKDVIHDTLRQSCRHIIYIAIFYFQLVILVMMKHIIYDLQTEIVVCSKDHVQFFLVKIVFQEAEIAPIADSLHGEITKARSEKDADLIVDIGYNDINIGDKAPDGAQLRPHIVWFGEAVPNIEPAAEMCEKADYFIVVGTSLVDYPAAGLIHYVPRGVKCYLVDPKPMEVSRAITTIAEPASTGVKKVVDELLALAE